MRNRISTTLLTTLLPVLLAVGFAGGSAGAFAATAFAQAAAADIPTAPTAPTAPAEARVTRVYFIGNSLTDNIRYEPLERLAAAAGESFVWGRHMIPGAPLSWLWDHPDDGFEQKPFGRSQAALRDHTWDVVSLQPFDRHLDGDTGDLASIANFLAVAGPQNDDTRWLIYAHTPRMRIDARSVKYQPGDFDPDKPAAQRLDLATIDDFGDLWTQPYPGRNGGSFESRDYYHQLTAALRQAHPDRRFERVPVGDVFHALHLKMKAGDVPGYTTAWQLYRDAIHLNPTGCYVIGLTYYTQITGRSPTGLPHEPYGNVDAALVPLIQQTVAEVVLDTAKGDKPEAAGGRE